MNKILAFSVFVNNSLLLNTNDNGYLSIDDYGNYVPVRAYSYNCVELEKLSSINNHYYESNKVFFANLSL